VSRDTQAAVAAVEGFVGAFNKMAETLDGLTDYDAEAEEGGVLIGDATLRGLEQGLRRALSGVTSEVPGAYRSLADLGLVTGRDGRLSLETGKLSEALGAEPQVVAELFAGAGGLAARLGESVSGYARANGLIDTRVEGLNSRIEDIGEQREALDRRIASLEERLLAQFSAMDRLVAELQSTGNFLTQQLASLPNMNQK
jgi:flagellar hook-associated protein 2